VLRQRFYGVIRCAYAGSGVREENAAARRAESAVATCTEDTLVNPTNKPFFGVPVRRGQSVLPAPLARPDTIEVKAIPRVQCTASPPIILFPPERPHMSQLRLPFSTLSPAAYQGQYGACRYDIIRRYVYPNASIT